MFSEFNFTINTFVNLLAFNFYKKIRYGETPGDGFICGY